MPLHPVISTLQDLVRINSVNPAYAAGVPEDAIQRHIAPVMEQAGFQVEWQQVLPDRPNVLATLPGRDRTRLRGLEAHVDTAGIDNVARDPFAAAIEDGLLWGRGACDTKAGLAAMMRALIELLREGFVPACDVMLAATVDEEHEYRGVSHLCAQLEPAGRTLMGAVVAEPTDLRLVVASKGCFRARVTFLGRAAHSAKPHLGINAISAAARLVASIEEDPALQVAPHPLLGPPTVNIGYIRGGVQINIVPQECAIEFDRRLVPGEDPDRIEQHYRSLAEQTAARFPGIVIRFERLLRDWPMETDPASSVATAAAAALAAANLPNEPTGVPFGSDASKFSRMGAPAIVLGPGSIDQAHTPDEYVGVEEVVRAVEVYKQLIRRF